MIYKKLCLNIFKAKNSVFKFQSYRTDFIWIFRGELSIWWNVDLAEFGKRRTFDMYSSTSLQFSSKNSVYIFTTHKKKLELFYIRIIPAKHSNCKIKFSKPLNNNELNWPSTFNCILFASIIIIIIIIKWFMLFQRNNIYGIRMNSIWKVLLTKTMLLSFFQSVRCQIIFT